MPRTPLDAYMTPPHYVAALLSEVNLFGRVYEPCVGDGAISEPMRRLPSVRKVLTNDLDRKRRADGHGDARGLAYDRVDWMVTNPPFSDELAIVENALDQVPNVAVLARLSFLEPTEGRAHTLESNPPQQVIVLPRYSFRLNDQGKKQTDNVTCCWLVWCADKTPRRMQVWSRGRSQAAAVLLGLSE